MILIDANILLYAEDAACEQNKIIQPWWDDLLSSDTRTCLSWEVINAFIRIATNKKIYQKPLPLAEAIARINSWLTQPNIEIVTPLTNHWEIFQTMMKSGQTTGNLITDAHLATLAITHGCTLYSTDVDFSRFSKLKWVNPLK